MSKLNKSQKTEYNEYKLCSYDLKNFQLAVLAGFKLIVIKGTEDIKLFSFESIYT